MDQAEHPVQVDRVDHLEHLEHLVQVDLVV